MACPAPYLCRQLRQVEQSLAPEYPGSGGKSPLSRPYEKLVENHTLVGRR
jgi:hypothetical protein